MKKLMVLLTFATMVSACSPQSKDQVLPASSGKTGAETLGGKNNQIEGTVNGGGGKGVLCKKNGQETLEILDLYEGRALYDLKYSKKYNSFDDALNAIIETRLKYAEYGVIVVPGWSTTDAYAKIKGDLLETFKRTRAKMKFIDSSKTLKNTNDANEAVVEDSCESKQVALYYDENILLVDKNLWDKLDFLNQAALLLHEVVYAAERTKGSTTSVATRRFVSHLLSDNGLRFLPAEMSRDQVYLCMGEPGAGIYAIQQGTATDPSVIVMNSMYYLSVFKDMNSIFRRSVTFKGATVDSNGLKIPPRDVYQKYEVYQDTIKDPVETYFDESKLPTNCKTLADWDKVPVAENQPSK